MGGLDWSTTQGKFNPVSTVTSCINVIKKQEFVEVTLMLLYGFVVLTCSWDSCSEVQSKLDKFYRLSGLDIDIRI